MNRSWSAAVGLLLAGCAGSRARPDTAADDTPLVVLLKSHGLDQLGNTEIAVYASGRIIFKEWDPALASPILLEQRLEPEELWKLIEPLPLKALAASNGRYFDSFALGKPLDQVPDEWRYAYTILWWETGERKEVSAGPLLLTDRERRAVPLESGVGSPRWIDVGTRNSIPAEFATVYDTLSNRPTENAWLWTPPRFVVELLSPTNSKPDRPPAVPWPREWPGFESRGSVAPVWKKSFLTRPGRIEMLGTEFEAVQRFLADRRRVGQSIALAGYEFDRAYIEVQFPGALAWMKDRYTAHWAPPPGTSYSPQDRLLEIGLTIQDQHVNPVSLVTLLWEATAALNAEASVEPPSRAESEGAAVAALEASLARVRSIRPTVSDSRLVEVAARAMVDSLGDQSSYISEEEVRATRLRADHYGRVGTLSLVLEKAAPYPRVCAVIANSPEEFVGIFVGEELRAVDEQSTAGLGPDQVEPLFRGTLTSQVGLTMGAPGAPSRILLLRRWDTKEWVDCRLVDDRILYVGLPELTENTLSQMKVCGDTAAHADDRVILDLRQTRGGQLRHAVQIADLFLESGEIIRVESQKRTQQEMAKANSSRFERSQVVVLIDEGSGLGAEQIAAALQDNHRATLVGQKTLGRGAFQLLYRLKQGDAMILVTAQSVRPNGTVLSGRGVTPDVLLQPGVRPSQVVVPDVPCNAGLSRKALGDDPAVVRAAQLLSAP